MGLGGGKQQRPPPFARVTGGDGSNYTICLARVCCAPGAALPRGGGDGCLLPKTDYEDEEEDGCDEAMSAGEEAPTEHRGQQPPSVSCAAAARSLARQPTNRGGATLSTLGGGKSELLVQHKATPCLVVVCLPPPLPTDAPRRIVVEQASRWRHAARFDGRRVKGAPRIRVLLRWGSPIAASRCRRIRLWRWGGGGRCWSKWPKVAGGVSRCPLLQQQQQQNQKAARFGLGVGMFMLARAGEGAGELRGLCVCVFLRQGNE